MSAVQALKKQEIQTAVTIKSVKIEKLFEIFDYDIEFAEGENVLILTGPNGFGKTTILRILYTLFSCQSESLLSSFLAPHPFNFFEKLDFNRISISLNNDNVIEIKKTSAKPNLSFAFYDNNGQLIDDELNIINGNYQFSKRSYEILNSVKVYLIKEQRLRKEITIETGDSYYDYTEEAVIEDSYNYGETQVIEDSIKIYSQELRDVFYNSVKKSYTISQEIDFSYPMRLISEKRKITKGEYNKRFEILREKQHKLIKYGLYEKQSTLEYSEADAKALLVYLDDLEKKLSVFDKLLEKLDLFTEILNKRRFTFKSIKINREKGFYFETSTGKELQMNELSSGEQHSVVLLYELIFNTTPNTLVLIDEPEISQHITWQKEFVRDLLRIIEIQNFQVMIATHAPAIVNGRWDLVYNLGKDI